MENRIPRSIANNVESTVDIKMTAANAGGEGWGH
jgi:hypothetical protein